MSIEGLTFWLVVVTAVLVGVTFYYAVTTHRILRTMERQAQTMREQSRLLAISTQATILTAATVEDESGRKYLNPQFAARIDELEAMVQRLTDQPDGDQRGTKG